MKKISLLLLTLILLIFATGCTMIKSDVTIKQDLTGTWKARVFTAEKFPQAEIEKELKSKGLTDFTMKEFVQKFNTKTGEEVKDISTTGPDFKDVNGWEITANFKNQEDFSKIIDCMQMAQGNGKKRPVNAFQKNEESGKVIVNLSNLKLQEEEKTIFHVEGVIEKETTHGKIINENTIEFYPNQAIIFTFKPGLPIPITPSIVSGSNNLIIGSIILIIIGLGVIYFKINSKNNNA